MADAFDQAGPIADAGAIGRWNSAFAKAAKAAPPLLYALRLWAAVCLALFVAFWLELDNPFWAGTSAAIVCLPQLGASLRKGWFRMVGTAVGATAIVILTACFPQDRIGFLGLLALWCGICAFTATVLRNFASYSAALAGYTAAIIAADNLGATGGASSDVFLLAVTRASEICIGIVSAGVVLAGTDLGGAQRRLAESFATLAAEIMDRFGRMLALAEAQLPETKAERREFARRVIALDPVIDQALGESSHMRYHSPKLQAAMYGLFGALDGWRGVATHLSRLPEAARRQGAHIILRSLPSELRSVPEGGSPVLWIADPLALHRVCEEAVRTLVALPADTPSLRLLADETAKVLAGLLKVLDGIALLVDAPGHPSPRAPRVRLTEPDWLPALINAARAFLAIGAVELFWVTTAWPNGASAIVFVAVLVLLLSPKGDLAYGGSLAFALGIAGAVVCAAAIKFAMLPALQTFPAFCAALGLFFLPAGFAVAVSRQPIVTAALTAMAFNFIPLLAPTNEMNYDTTQYYNSALAIVVGCGVAPLAFLLLPPLSPALRVRRLLALTTCDLRRLAIAPVLPAPDYWESRLYSRLTALPDQATPLQRAQLLAALSVGTEIIGLRQMATHLGTTAELDAALNDIALGHSTRAIAKLRRFDDRLASTRETGTEATMALRGRGRVLIISEAIAEHGHYFDAGAPA
ncbi:FUSC family protein [Bradyrhizobium sp. URHD0069]|uniref:FUSC family protein n=1 Tax=Bradyrhizobium sp. URHD0069 TaxID=1380355 RepID=UPI00068C9F78|nr:FUSC family protein [Bradyrhizobium sp. URHD0069]